MSTTDEQTKTQNKEDLFNDESDLTEALNEIQDEKELITQNEWFNTITQTDKILAILYDYPSSTKEQIKSCYPVTSVTSVTQNFLKGGNKGNKGNEVTNISLGVVKVLLHRFETEKQDKYVSVDRSAVPHKYSLTLKGETYILSKYNEFVELKEYEARQIKIKEDSKAFLDAVNDYVLNNEAELITSEGVLVLDIKALSRVSPVLAEEFLDFPENSFSALKYVFEKIKPDFNEFNIRIVNLPDSSKKTINKTRVKDFNKLICLVAELKDRSSARVQVMSATFECPSCGNVINIAQGEAFSKEPASCSCGRKGKFIEIKRDLVDVIHLSVSDPYDILTPQEVAENINVELLGEHHNFEFLREGEVLKFNGVLRSVKKFIGGGKKSVVEEKLFSCFGVEKTSFDIKESAISEEDKKVFGDIVKDPVKYFSPKFFNDLDDVELPALISLIGAFGDLNILFLGDPGTGKSQIARRVCKAHFRGGWSSSISSSGAGVIGAVEKNNFTGKYSLSGGLIRKLHPFGLVGVDEINRDVDQVIQKTLLGVMSDRRLTINKAGASIDVSADVSVWATANLKSDNNSYDSHRSLQDNFGVLSPLWDRFDFKVFFNNSFSLKRGLISKLLKLNKRNFEPKNEDLAMFRKYLFYGRSLDVKFNDKDYSKLADIVGEVFSKVATNSYRRLHSVKGLLVAICRAHHRVSPIKEDFVLLSDIFIKLNNAQEEYVNERKGVD